MIVVVDDDTVQLSFPAGVVWLSAVEARRVGFEVLGGACEAGRHVLKRDTATERLFGLPHAERLYRSLEECYESEIDPWADEQGHRSQTIEEWTVAVPDSHVPHADTILDFIADWVADNGELDEDGSDAFGEACRSADVGAAVEALRQTLVSNVAYRMADRRVAIHDITWDADGEPLVDGVRLYRASGV